MLTSPTFLALVAFIAAVAVLQWRWNKDVRAARKGLTLEELRVYRFNYANPRRRADMPEKFAAFAKATDRVKPANILAFIAIAAAIFVFIYVGPYP